MVYWTDGRDYCDNCYVLNFNNYINNIKEQLIEYNNKIYDEIKNKEEKLKESGVILYEN